MIYLHKMNKTKVFFAVPYPKGRAPSQRFRFEQYLKLLEKNNIKWTLSSFYSLSFWEILYAPGKGAQKVVYLTFGFAKRFLDLLIEVPFSDIVFVHREATPLGPPWFEWCVVKIFKKKLVYDFDDAIWLGDDENESRMFSFLKWRKKVKFICEIASKVSVGNNYLKEYAEKFSNNVVLNPTTIDTENWHNPNRVNKETDNSVPVIGWTGSHSTLKYLEPLIPCLEEITAPFRFIVISNKKPEFTLKQFEFKKWNKSFEIQDLMEFDLGVMPLTEDAWSSGKCGFKALQYMALGKPALVSPVGVNKEIVDHEVNGFVCDNPEEWGKYLKLMIEQPELRKVLGETAREKVISHYSVQCNTLSFLSFFD